MELNEERQNAFLHRLRYCIPLERLTQLTGIGRIFTQKIGITRWAMRYIEPSRHY